ncbi:pseudouridine synthase, RluA family [Marvinbryantia formatexigens DSM 14469]|uniref:RNA pseudouridylate synthase n=1 Tax=Marvinbryantia formatexigens DSM 14469 TaxID=478749 RepID=C6LLS0_9FIRM|nr:RluA family pseudouridine synthase [Marvinbryantia formatexigens]EET58461.1 pseudouridine synthase, RluA family [Marvinbryantia formatexigens DSM 14469]UWO24653.1 RluA family pseudouridine synthase [Marvinbryantia formatexigens DSM 14469]SDF17560.1 23S rRNA pseudouridine955/2504/2580 synthase [Marvinbryantia formatexigens]
MKEIIVRENEAGQRLDKLLARYLCQAPKSFLYKMLRKKNITLNGKKASGNEITAKEDCIRIFLSDETYEKFSAGEEAPPIRHTGALTKEQIIYEDGDILVLNKPAGMLSQKSRPEDVSANEYFLSYLLETGQISAQELRTFHPSICNRLDRNTSGLLLAGKSLAGLQAMAEALKDRSLHKYYLCLVSGSLTKGARLEGFLVKDEAANKVKICATDMGDKEAKPISTQYVPLWTDGKVTLLKIWLITGRAHQIRAHLSGIGHPIIGDGKYGDRRKNVYYEKTYHLKGQLLHAFQMKMPPLTGTLSRLSGQEFIAPLPENFRKILADAGCDTADTDAWRQTEFR